MMPWWGANDFFSWGAMLRWGAQMGWAVASAPDLATTLFYPVTHQRNYMHMEIK